MGKFKTDIPKRHLPPNEAGEYTYCKQSNYRTGIATPTILIEHDISVFLAMNDHLRCGRCLRKYNNSIR